MQRKEETKEKIEDHLPEDHKTSKEVRYLKRITHPLNVMHVIRWDTLIEIVLMRNINSRRRTESSMPIQSKRMNCTKRRLEIMKTLVNNMS